MKTSKFSLSHYKMISQRMGTLWPAQCVPVIPGDTFQGSTSMVIRMAPLNTPVMHPLQVRVDHWFVPYRILDPNWEEFITGNPNSYSLPTITPVTTPGFDNLARYFDISESAAQSPVLAYPYYAYAKIYNERYRDQDLAPERIPTAQVAEPISWEKDYYTTARPWSEKGGAVQIPVKANAFNSGDTIGLADYSGQNRLMDTSGTNLRLGAAQGGLSTFVMDPNDMRLGMALQRYKEARARYGSRFTEYLRYLGITPSDSRLQQPELLGSGRGMMNFSEVLQTAPNEGGDGVGDLYGHGIAGIRTSKWRRFFEEHGVVMTMVSLRPKSVYTNVTLREWLKQTPEDFFQKEFTHLGEQPLWNGEVFPEDDSNLVRGTFGWTPRYEEYRTHPSSVKGEFETTLNSWHMARDFSAPPTLNQSFVECDPTTRIFQETTGDHLYCMVNNSLVARRMLPRSPRPRIM